MAARSPFHSAGRYVGPHRHLSASWFPQGNQSGQRILKPFFRLHLPYFGSRKALPAAPSAQLPGGVRVDDGSGATDQGPARIGRDAGRNLGGSKGSSAKIPKAQCHFTPHSQRTRVRFETLDQKLVKRKTRARIPGAKSQTLAIGDVSRLDDGGKNYQKQKRAERLSIKSSV